MKTRIKIAERSLLCILKLSVSPYEQAVLEAIHYLFVMMIRNLT